MTITVSDLDKMRMGIEYRFTVRLRDFACRFRPLTVLETTQIAMDTADQLEKDAKLRATPLSENLLFAIKTLARASSSGPDARDNTLHESVLQQLTPDELMFLFKSYNAVVDRVNPLFEELGGERLDELIRLAKKNPGALIDCSFAEVVGVCRALLASPPEAS